MQYFPRLGGNLAEETDVDVRNGAQFFTSLETTVRPLICFDQWRGLVRSFDMHKVLPNFALPVDRVTRLRGLSLGHIRAGTLGRGFHAMMWRPASHAPATNYVVYGLR